VRSPLRGEYEDFDGQMPLVIREATKRLDFVKLGAVLDDALGSGDQTTITNVLQALGTIGGDEAAAVILDRVDDTEGNIRAQQGIARALKRTRSTTALGALAEWAASNPDPAVRAHSATGIAQMRSGEAASAIDALLASPEVEIRLNAIRALKSTRRLTKDLRTRLRADPSPEVRRAVRSIWR
jgi:HEAT repeat protein